MIPPDAKRPYQEIVEFLLSRLSATGVITDMAPGGVARTVMEAAAREFSETYAKMNAVYEAGFIDTATGASLDHLVAILGLSRISGEAHVAELRLQRDKRISARVIVPIGTEIAVTRAVGDRVIYRVADDYEMRQGEASLVVAIRALPEGDADVALSPDDVALGQIAMVRPIAGIAGQKLEGPSVSLGVKETDQQLRDRAKMAISAAGGGTEKALTEALMAVPIVKSVQLRDASDTGPDGLPAAPPGELEIVLDAPEDELAAYRDQIAEAIETHKGPGILARVSTTRTRTLTGTLMLKPASDGLTGRQALKLVADAEALIKAEVEALEIGGTLVWNRLLAGLMGLENVADLDMAASGLSLAGGTPGAADVTTGAFERMALGQGLNGVAVLIDERPVLTLGLTVTPGTPAPGPDQAQGLEDALVRALTAYVEALNTPPVDAARAVALADLLALTNALGRLTGPVTALDPAWTALHVTDMTERAQATLTGAAAPIPAQAAALIRLAQPPVTLVWEPDAP